MKVLFNNITPTFKPQFRAKPESNEFEKPESFAPIPVYPTEIPALSKQKDEQVLLTAKKALEQKIKTNQKLTKEDAVWLKPLFDAFKSEPMDIEFLNDETVVPWGNEHIPHTPRLLDTINAVLAAGNDKSISRQFDNYKIRVNNAEVNNNLQEKYDSKSFDKLFKLCDENKVFDINFDNYGFPKTTNIDKTEDAAMHSNVWVTDTLRCFDLIKDKYPEKAPVILDKISTFYNNQERTFKLISKTPDSYMRDNFGVSHLFNPETLEPNRNYIACRLDSQALYLEKASNEILNGHKPNKEMINALTMIPIYLSAINFPNCVTCGNWENTAMFSVTSDNEIVRNGLNKLRQVLESDEPEVKKTAVDLENNFKKIDSDWRLSNYYPDTLYKTVYKVERAAEQDLMSHYQVEQSTFGNNHEKDAALAFVGASAVLNKNNVVSDVVRNLMVLDNIKQLAGENGIERYENDAYENTNYELGIDSDDNFAFHNIKQRWYMINTSPSALKNKAQWFMVSDMSKAYGTQLQKLIQATKDRQPTEEEAQLMDYCLKHQTEYINRAYARITGQNLTKANGRECKPWQVPESYMSVSSLDDIKTNKPKTFLPGTNTPLSWAKASLYDASKLYKENLKDLNT